MSDIQKLSLTVLHTVAEFLALLPVDQLNDLAEGTARLAIISKEATEPLRLAPPPTPVKRPSGLATAEPTADMSDIRDRLEKATTREEAKELLMAFNQKPHLTALARLLGMSGHSHYRKEELADAIVEFTVGNRLNSGAIRQL